MSLIPLERFTDEAREALARVQQLLLRLRHNQLDAEHLLLGLLGEPDGLVKAAFQKLDRSEEHTSELQSQSNLVCRLLIEKKNKHLQCVVSGRNSIAFGLYPRSYSRW